MTLPEPTQPGGASDRQGPLIAAWNCGEVGLIPLPGPSWPPWPLGLGKAGTPFARMHLAKARVKLPAVDWPWLPVRFRVDTCPLPPVPVPAEPAPAELLGADGCPKTLAHPVPSSVRPTAAAAATVTVTVRQAHASRRPPAARVAGILFIFPTVPFPLASAAVRCRGGGVPGVSNSETPVTGRS